MEKKIILLVCVILFGFIFGCSEQIDSKQTDVNQSSEIENNINTKNEDDVTPDINLSVSNNAICEEDWICEEWNDCLETNIQIRICSEMNNCNTALNKPKEIQDCNYIPPCIEDWECSEWSICTDHEQKKTCKDNHLCGTDLNKPALTQYCAENCIENWACGGWGSCYENKKTRFCNEYNHCGTELLKPITEKECVPCELVPVTDKVASDCAHDQIGNNCDLFGGYINITELGRDDWLQTYLIDDYYLYHYSADKNVNGVIETHIFDINIDGSTCQVTNVQIN